MARKTKDNPTNLSADDIAHSLRTAAFGITDAKEKLEAAREPLRNIKAVVKATGIGWDIFAMVAGIANLDDQAQRDKRWRQLLVAINAILKGKVTGDLLGFDVSISPAAAQSLREASDKLGEVQPAEREDVDAEPQDQEIPFDIDPPSVPEPEAMDEDIPALMAAEDMPENAGYIANNGLQAGRLGHDADANPHPTDSVEARLWEQGRVRGAALGPYVDQQDGQGEGAQPVGAEVTDIATAKRGKITGADKMAAYFAGFDGAANDLFTEDCPHDRGALKTNWLLGLDDAKAGKPARFVRPAAAADQQDEASPETEREPNFDDQGLVDTENGEIEDEPVGRVEVREIDGKHVLFDLLDNAPLMDVSGPKAGETWANQINAHFSDCLETATRTDLLDAAKTLARGRLLTVPTAPTSYDTRATA